MCGIVGLSLSEPEPWAGEFVACMENVLDLYQQPYDPEYPLVCMDEASKQLVGEVRVPIPAAPGRPLRVDYEYERKGTANIFMFTEPLTGWRWAPITDQRTKVDWALAIKELLLCSAQHKSSYGERAVMRRVLREARLREPEAHSWEAGSP